MNSDPMLTRINAKKMAYLALGFVALGLGIVGAFVPLLPTTCFILLAAWAFARSSERWHQKLRFHPQFGATVRNWEDHRSLSHHSKRIAVISIICTFAISLFLLRDSLLIIALLLTIMIILLVYIATRPEF